MSHTPTLIRARKLLAFLAPESGAADAERRLAQAKLDELIAETGLKLSDIVDAVRTERKLYTVDQEEMQLAAQVARWIAAENDLRFDCSNFEEKLPKRRGKAKVVRVWVLHAWLSDQEERDWRPACEHYLQILRQQRKQIKADLAVMRRALKYAVSGVVSRYNLFGPSTDDSPGRKSSKAEREALIAAIRAAEGKQWKRPAPRLSQSSLPLA